MAQNIQKLSVAMNQGHLSIKATSLDASRAVLADRELHGPPEILKEPLLNEIPQQLVTEGGIYTLVQGDDDDDDDDG